MNKEQLKQHIVENILPQEKDTTYGVAGGLPYAEDLGYNRALQDTHNKLDEVVNYIYADLREKIEKVESHLIEITDYEVANMFVKQDILDLLTNKE